jgi:hypothetical protein
MTALIQIGADHGAEFDTAMTIEIVPDTASYIRG